MATPYSYIDARADAARRAAPFLYGPDGLPNMSSPPPNLAPYGIPFRGAMPPPARVAPATAPVAPPALGLPPTAAAAPATQAPAPSAPPAPPTAAQRFRGLVDAAQAAQGSPLDRTDFARIAERYWASDVIPSLIANKETEGRVKLRRQQFESKAEQFYENYSKETMPDAEQEQDTGVLSKIGDVLLDTVDAGRNLGAGVLSGTAQLVPAAEALLDYGIRLGRPARQAIFNPVDSFNTVRDVAGDVIDGDISAATDKLANTFGLGEPTFLGRDAAQRPARIREAVQDTFLSDRGKKQIQNLSTQLAAGDIAGAIVDNPLALPYIVGEAGASLLGGLPLRTATAVRALAKVPAFVQALTASTVVGLPQSASTTAQFEGNLREMTLADLIKDNPEGQQTYDVLSDALAGMPQVEIDAAVKNAIINKATGFAGVINVAGDVGLSAIVPGGGEQIAAGLTRGLSRSRRIASTAGAEVLEEGGAGGLQQAGQNVATNQATGQNTPVMQGVAGQTAIGGLVGGLVGTAVAIPGSSGGVPIETPPVEDVPVEPEVEPPVEAPAPEAGAVPPAAEEISVGIDEEAADKLTRGVVSKVSQYISTTKGKQLLAQATTPAKLYDVATGLARTRSGKTWDKLSPEQRFNVTESVANKLNERLKLEGVDTVGEALRASVVPPAVAPTPTVTEQPLPEGLAEGLAAAQAAREAREAEAATVAPTPTVAPTAWNESATLMPELAKAAPRYKLHKLTFPNDLTRALYTLGNSKSLSKRDKDYLEFAMRNTGLSEADVRAEGAKVRESLKSVAASATDEKGTLRVPKAKPPKVAPSPNVVAPAPVQASGAKQAEASPLESPEPVARETPEALVTRVIGDGLSEDEALDLGAAIIEARDGDKRELNRILRELQGEEVITQEQAAEIRAQATTTPLPSSFVSDGNADESSVDSSNNDARKLDAETLLRRATKATGTTNKKLVELLNLTSRSVTATKAEKSLASRLAKLAAKIQTKLRIPKNPPSGTVAGTFNRDTNTVTIHYPGHEVTLHEVVHAVTSNMLSSENAKLNVTGVNTLRKDMDALLRELRAHLNSIPGDVKSTDEYLQRIFSAKKGPQANVRELLAYGMTSDRFAQYLNTIPSKATPTRSLWQRFKDIIARFLGDTPSERTLLDNLLEVGENALTFAEKNPQLIADINLEEKAISVQPSKALQPSFGGVSEFQRAFEKFSNSVIGLEFTDIELYNQGIELTPEQSMYVAGRNFSGHVVDMRQSDERAYVKPIGDMLARMWNTGKFGGLSWKDFESNLDDFFQAYHLLYERGPSLYAESVELKDGRDVDRADIVEQMETGQMSAADGIAAIKQLAADYSTESFRRWAYRSGVIPAPNKLDATLKKLNAQGYNTTTLGELNEALERVRQRSQVHLRNAGITSPSDPWVEGRDWKWYVPIRSEQPAIENYNYGGSTFKNRNLSIIKGGREEGDLSSLNNLVIQMGASSDAEAESTLTQKAWDLISEHPEIFNAEITEFKGFPKRGFTFGKDDGKFATSLPNPNNGFVHHQGDSHFVVRLPTTGTGGQLARGLKGFRSISNFQNLPGVTGKVFSVAGGATNILSRLYTTWSLSWQAFTSFFRNTMEVPTVIAVELYKNPLKASKFFAKFAQHTVQNVFAVRGLIPEMRAVLTGDKSALNAYADAHPGSTAWWTKELLENGGSSEFAASFNQIKATDALFGKLARAERGILDLPAAAYRTWNQATSGFASFVEYKTRAAAFQSLVELGYSKSHSASLTKGALDFNQSGEWGRNINALHSFYRVGATDIDNIRRVFTAKDGTLDMGKIAAWSPFMAMLSTIGYMMVAAMLGDDDDGVPKIKKVDPYTLTQRMILPWGDGRIGYPIGLGLPQLLLAPGTLAAAVFSGNMTPEEAGEAYLRVVERNLPVQPVRFRKDTGASGTVAGWLAGLTTPTLVSPLVETAINTNSFGYAIHTPYPKDDVFRSAQAKGSTPQEWTDMATALREWTGWDVFPEDLRQMTRAYAGQPGSAITRWAFDVKAKEDAGIEVRSTLQALRLDINDADFYYTRQLYNALDILEDAAKLKHAQGKDASYEITRRVKEYKELKSARAKYNGEIAALRANKLLSTTGRRDKRKRADSRLREAVNKAEAVIESTEQ